MVDDARAHFEKYVAPAVNDWRRTPTDERLGMNAAVALNQMVDHFFHSFPAGHASLLGSGSVTALRDALIARLPSFALVRDVADAHKHKKLTRATRSLTSAGQTEVASMGWDEAEYGVATFGGAPELVVTLDDGRRRHLSAAIEGSYAMWVDLLQ